MCWIHHKLHVESEMTNKFEQHESLWDYVTKPMRTKFFAWTDQLGHQENSAQKSSCLDVVSFLMLTADLRQLGLRFF